MFRAQVKWCDVVAAIKAIPEDGRWLAILLLNIVLFVASLLEGIFIEHAFLIMTLPFALIVVGGIGSDAEIQAWFREAQAEIDQCISEEANHE